jgi:hypothetical protein
VDHPDFERGFAAKTSNIALRQKPSVDQTTSIQHSFVDFARGTSVV